MASLTINRLRETAQRLAAAQGEARMGLLGELGLFIHDELGRWTYSDTPMNSVTFASTGGDGVHFGVLTTLVSDGHDGPVVMTVPLKGNIVVAECVREFLELGYHHGWFRLEQLVYREAWTVETYAELPDFRPSVLDALCLELALRPRALTSTRLLELRGRYLPAILPKA